MSTPPPRLPISEPWGRRPWAGAVEACGVRLHPGPTPRLPSPGAPSPGPPRPAGLPGKPPSRPGQQKEPPAWTAPPLSRSPFGVVEAARSAELGSQGGPVGPATQTDTDRQAGPPGPTGCSEIESRSRAAGAVAAPDLGGPAWRCRESLASGLGQGPGPGTHRTRLSALGQGLGSSLPSWARGSPGSRHGAEEEPASPSHRLLAHSQALPGPALPVPQLLPPYGGPRGHPTSSLVPTRWGARSWPVSRTRRPRCFREGVPAWGLTQPAVPTASMSGPAGLEPRAAQQPSSPSSLTHRSLLPSPLALPRTITTTSGGLGLKDSRAEGAHGHWPAPQEAPRGLLAPQPQLPRFLQVTPGLGAPHTPSRGLSPPAELARLPLGRQQDPWSGRASREGQMRLEPPAPGGWQGRGLWRVSPAPPRPPLAGAVCAESSGRPTSVLCESCRQKSSPSRGRVWGCGRGALCRLTEASPGSPALDGQSGPWKVSGL